MPKHGFSDRSWRTNRARPTALSQRTWPNLTYLTCSDDGTFVVRGTIEHGDHRGRTLGVPTANIAMNDLVLEEGVWAGWFERTDGTVHPSAISIGVRSTFYGRHGVRLLEAHLLDFDGDLYGEDVEVSLVRRLRGQRTFDSLEGLIKQMNFDIAATRKWSTSGPGRKSLTRVAVPGLTRASGR
jgi:hypothetical protein